MKYESAILKRLIDTYGVVGNPKYISEIIKEFIVQGKECYPNLFTYQADWLAHIDEFGLSPSYTVSYTGQSIYAPNTLERPVKSAILKGNTGYRDIDTGEFLETFEEGRNLELVSVKMPVLTTTGKNLFDKNNYTEVSGSQFYSNVIGGENVATGSGDENHKWMVLKLPIGETYSVELDKRNTYHSNWTNSVVESDVNTILKGATYRTLVRETSDTTKISRHTFTTTKPYVFIHVGYDPKYSQNKQELLDSMMLNVGSNVATYEPYKSNILTTPEDLELRGIGNVRDELNCLTGELTERIGEIVLDGSDDEKWTIHTSSNGTGKYFALDADRNTPNILKSVNVKGICDKIPYVSYSVIDDGGFGFNISYCIRLHIQEVNIYNGATLTDLSTYLQQNPITIQYQLNTESIKTVDLTIKDQNDFEVSQLSSFNGGTHFSSSSQVGSLLPTISVDVVTDLEETLNLCSLDGNTM